MVQNDILGCVTYNELLRLIRAKLLTEADSRGRVIVGVDGPDCSGKTRLCQALNGLLKEDHTSAVIHFDDYLNPLPYRIRRGEFSIEGFLFDFFDERALIDSVLKPAKCRYQATSPPQILLVEGLFLFRPELNPYFDVRIRLDIDANLVVKRAMQRDAGRIGEKDWVKRHYVEQCLPAQEHYRRSVKPETLADIHVVVLDDDAYEIRSALTS